MRSTKVQSDVRLHLRRSTSYAVCALNRLVHARPAHGEIAARDLAEEVRIPSEPLRKALGRLARAGFVEAVTGLGCRAGARGRAATLLDVVGALGGGDLAREGCLVGGSGCRFAAVCPLAAASAEIRLACAGAFGRVGISALPVGPGGIPVCFCRERSRT